MTNATDTSSRNASASLVLRLSGAALGMVMHITLARVLSVGDYGMFSVGLTIATLASVLASVGMPFCAVRFLPTYVADNDTVKTRMFERTSLLFTGFGLLGFALLGAMIYGLAAPILSETIRTGLLVALPLLIVMGFAQTQHALMVARGLIRRADALQSVLRPALTIIAVLALAAVVSEPNLGNIVTIWTVVGVILMVLMWRAYPFAAKSQADSLDRPLVKSWIRVGFVIMLTATGTAMMERLDILIIGLFLSAEDVAIYSVASRIALIGAIAINAANAAFGPALSVAVNARESAEITPLARRAAVMPTLCLAAFFLVVVVAGKLILSIFGATYATGYAILMILAGAQLLVATFGATGGITVFAGGERMVVRTVLLALACNLVLNLILVPTLGAIGAAIGSLVALLVLQIRLAIWCHGQLGVRTDLWHIRP